MALPRRSGCGIQGQKSQSSSRKICWKNKGGDQTPKYWCDVRPCLTNCILVYNCDICLSSNSRHQLLFSDILYNIYIIYISKSPVSTLLKCLSGVLEVLLQIETVEGNPCKCQFSFLFCLLKKKRCCYTIQSGVAIHLAFKSFLQILKETGSPNCPVYVVF